MTRRIVTFLVLAIAAAGYTATSFAHALDQSYVFLKVYDDRIDGRVEISMTDLNSAVGGSFRTDRTATLEDIAPHIEKIRRYVKDRVSLSVNDAPAGLPLTGYRFTDDFAQYLALEFSLDELVDPPLSIEINYGILFDTRPNHRGLLVVEHNWKTNTFDNEANVALIFSPDKRRQTLDLSDSSVWRGFSGLVGMGIHHIWIGIDHILFLLALLLPAVVYRRDGAWRPATSFRDALIYVIKVVTVFTVAHTITLSLAALGAISLSSRLVESVIALSIAVAALNIFFPVFRDRIWWVVFAFGLFHGFGFASVLGEIGIPANYMVHSLLGFNLGVEIGQVAIVCALFPVLYVLRRHPVYTGLILRAGAATLIVISLYWFTERAFLVDLPAGAIVNSVIGVFR